MSWKQLELECQKRSGIFHVKHVCL